MARSISYSDLVILMAIIYMMATTVNGQCRGDLSALAQQCARYVSKPGPIIPPSKACCAVVKAVDVGCLCNHLPPGAAGIISMQKATYCCKYCGNPLPPGTRCGGK